MFSNDSELSISRQCSLLSIIRSNYYYIHATESDLNIKLMSLIDRHFLDHPYLGARQMASFLRRQGFCVSRKRVRRLMKKMCLNYCATITLSG